MIPKSRPAEDETQTAWIRWGPEFGDWNTTSRPTDAIEQRVDQYGRHPLEGEHEYRPDSDAGWTALCERVLAGPPRA